MNGTARETSVSIMLCRLAWAPTHGHGCFVDLVLPDLESGLKTRGVNDVSRSDHCGVLMSIARTISLIELIARHCLGCKSAGWNGFNVILHPVDCGALLGNNSVDDGLCICGFCSSILVVSGWAIVGHKPSATMGRFDAPMVSPPLGNNARVCSGGGVLQVCGRYSR